jgi:predicted GNAT family acetyltransferase
MDKDIDLDSLRVTNNEEKKRFEAAVGDDVAVAEYDLHPDKIIFTHTEVPAAMTGKGVAGKLVQHALDDARKRKLRVVPLCAYVASYIKRHPEYEELVEESV